MTRPIHRVPRAALAIAALASAGTGCDLNDPSAGSLDRLVRIDAASDTLPADGVSRLQLTATLRTDTQDTVSIAFHTSAGTLAGASGDLVVKASTNQAIGFLVAGRDVGTAVVTATAKGFAAIDTVRFVPAYPTALTMAADRLSAPANGATPVNLTLRFRRPLGAGGTSVGVRAELTAIDLATGLELRQLRRTVVSTMQDDMATAVTSIQTGDVQLIARTIDGPEVKDSVTVHFTAP